MALPKKATIKETADPDPIKSTAVDTVRFSIDHSEQLDADITLFETMRRSVGSVRDLLNNKFIGWLKNTVEELGPGFRYAALDVNIHLHHSKYSNSKYKAQGVWLAGFSLEPAENTSVKFYWLRYDASGTQRTPIGCGVFDTVEQLPTETLISLILACWSQKLVFKKNTKDIESWFNTNN